MKPIELVRNNLRISILVALIALACFFLFVPGAGLGDDIGGNETAVDTPTNLKYGIELGGGARLRAPVDGVTAENVDVQNDEAQAIADQLGVDLGRVQVQSQDGTVEVFSGNVTTAELESALEATGHSSDSFSVRTGVTAETRDDMIEVLETRVQSTGFTGATVNEVQVGDDWYLVIEAPGRNVDIAELRDVLQNRGVVQVVAHYPTDNASGNGSGYEQQIALRQDEIKDVGQVENLDDQDGFGFSVTLKQSAAADYSDLMVETGIASSVERGSGCNYNENTDPSQWGYCQLIVYDDETVTGLTMNPNLGTLMESDQFASQPTFQVTTPDRQSAQEVQTSIQTGSLPAQLDLGENSSSYEIQPEQAQQFRTSSAITGLIAVLTVVLVVFLRYGNPRVAAPMSLTALSEVVILLGFAAAIKMPIDLSHVAGFIAVVGTGVDDLIIIADEVLSEDGVSSGRVFDSRFKKAFWVIGAAAATTIIAMSPLAVLSLGDLRGFAIITILGVLIGVFITRPAYGNILRRIKTEN
ncbi:preprotein translocase subunit SecD [Natronoarchaeum philippinense]|uniref:Protein-export membrane protein SecD n=1 Tax=Natronoarchaeum philippinense TaxID=558529 RepID=A0A285P2B6_NATPI|nr:preprotein translocase subunit SecD [Natronoarchaeum philippinense]SNZ15860.1 preprotein translocase subunit SecD [Natronoarchaeum philippinense]